jgi:Glu-tRNA(Gln) amidotransferase subunit E-like FAD-binding protein
LNHEIYERVFRFFAEGKVLKDGVLIALDHYLRVGELHEVDLPRPATSDEIETRINMAVKQLNHVIMINPEKKFEVMMGLIMDDMRGRVDGNFISVQIQKFLN